MPKAGRFFGKVLSTYRGVTQFEHTSFMIFNIIVDKVVQALLDVVYGPQEAQHGLRWEARKCNLTFYADSVRIAERDHVWFQDALSVTAEMFCSIGLKKP